MGDHAPVQLRHLILAAVLGGALAWVAPAAAGSLEFEKIEPRHYRGAELCAEAIEAGIRELKIERADVTNISVVPNMVLKGDSEVVLGYEAWLTRASCDGAVVLTLSLRCEMTGWYAGGDCEGKLP